MGEEARAKLLGRITSEPSVLHGQPCIRDVRVPVGMILDSMAEGMSEDEILAELPSLERDDIHAALAYAGCRVREEIVPLMASA